MPQHSILDSRFMQGSRIECQLTFERFCIFSLFLVLHYASTSFAFVVTASLVCYLSLFLRVRCTLQPAEKKKRFVNVFSWDDCSLTLWSIRPNVFVSSTQKRALSHRFLLTTAIFPPFFIMLTNTVQVKLMLKRCYNPHIKDTETTKFPNLPSLLSP